MEKDAVYRSERLTYRGISYDDADDIVRWRSEPDNYKNFFNARPITKEGHLAWFKRYLSDTTRYDFMIIDAEGRPIGTVGLSDITEDSCEISYMIGATDVRGKGYAAEAIKTLSQVAFDELGVTEVVARILPDNEASIRTILKAGYARSELVYSIKSEQ